MAGLGLSKQAGAGKRDSRLLNFFKLVTPGAAPAKGGEALARLVADLPREQADKVKISFAEGFAAGQTTERGGGLWGRWGAETRWKANLLFLLTVLLVAYYAVRLLAAGGWGGVAVEVTPEQVAVTFDDVRANEEAKEELHEVVDFLRDPEKYVRLGGRLPKGVLLVGPPGTGKTLLARAVAGEAGVPFFHVSGSEFDEMLVGQGAKRVRELFAVAKERAPCVVFIDEIDSVGMKRTNSALHPFANQTINQLLNEMDGFQQNEGVVVLGATNRKGDLDRALLRPGRFDVEVFVRPPELAGRADIFRLYLGRVALAPDVSAERLAKGTTGFTGADIENMVNIAAIRAAADGQPAVSMHYLEAARDKIMMGPERKHRIPDEQTNRNTAFHEAGHTLVALHTRDATPLHKVTIIPRAHSLGVTAFAPDKDEYGQTRAQLLAQLDTAMGGRAAEELVFGPDQVTTGIKDDLDKATRIATFLVKELGMSEKLGLRTFPEERADAVIVVNELSDATSELIDSEIKRLLNEAYERARAILVKHAAEHRRLAEALLKYETLDADEVRAVVEGRPVQRPPTAPPPSTPGHALLLPRPQPLVLAS